LEEAPQSNCSFLWGTGVVFESFLQPERTTIRAAKESSLAAQNHSVTHSLLLRCTPLTGQLPARNKMDFLLTDFVLFLWPASTLAQG
jgi:hypothetical protein